MTGITRIDDIGRAKWIHAEDPTDKNHDITADDVNETKETCTMYSARAAADLDIEGIGGGDASAETSYMILDYAAMTGVRVNGVGKMYGFGVRAVASITDMEVNAHSNITGLVASAHLGNRNIKIEVRTVGIAQPPKWTGGQDLNVDTYSQLMVYKNEVDDLLRSGKAHLNPTLMMVERIAPPAPKEEELLKDSYRLLTVRGIQKGAARKAWKDYITGPKATRRLRDPVLFDEVADGTYEMFGIDGDARPTKSQIAAALERTDGVFAERTGSF